MYETIKMSNPQVYLRANDDATLIGYFINGDSLGTFTKKECEQRIKSLYKAGRYDKDTKNILLQQLKDLKRPLKKR